MGKYYPMMKVRPPVADTAGEDTEVKCWDTVQLKYETFCWRNNIRYSEGIWKKRYALTFIKVFLEGLKTKILTGSVREEEIGTETCRSKRRDGILCSVKDYAGNRGNIPRTAALGFDNRVLAGRSEKCPEFIWHWMQQML